MGIHGTIGKQGHWAGDTDCEFVKSGQKPRCQPAAKSGAESSAGGELGRRPRDTAMVTNGDDGDDDEQTCLLPLVLMLVLVCDILRSQWCHMWHPLVCWVSIQHRKVRNERKDPCCGKAVRLMAYQLSHMLPGGALYASQAREEKANSRREKHEKNAGS